jgi:hypothetical protein
VKDLDFDELDKAVNSLMANGGKDSDVSQAPTVPPASSDSVPVSVVSSPTKAPSPVIPSRSAPLAARRGGRFMDVVHPSVNKEATPPVSRQAPTIQPTAPGSLPPDTKEPELETPKQALPQAQQVEPQTNDWPDPLELMADSTDKNAELDDKELAVTPSDELPLSSPFLPDTKVEKRPLGGAAPEPNNALMVEDENAQLPALPRDVEPVLPEELHGDIASIEADNSTTDPSRHAAQQSAAEEVHTKKEDFRPRLSESPKVVTVTEATVPSGPTSISQQYKEEPSSGDQHSGAIYDTDSYHQPLSHPMKKKSGWSWVFWILLILLIGAGSGAALYLLGIVK